MSFKSRLSNANMPFLKFRFAAFLFSAAVIGVTFFLLFSRGLQLGIDFSGGILLELQVDAPLEDVRSLFTDNEDWGEVALQDLAGEGAIMLRVQTSEEEEQAERVAELKAMLGIAFPDIIFRKVDYVGPTIGQELIESGIMALVIAMAAMMLYIWFRFEWQFGLGAIIALAHDSLFMLGFYVITGFDFGLTSIAAVLTVIGYSINDSVVIYDRIRENMRKYKKRKLADVIDLSLNQTLSRTIVTALTTALAALALALFGGHVLEGFSYALLVGVLVGTYSSIFVAAPVLLYFGLRSEAFDEPEEDNRP